MAAAKELQYLAFNPYIRRHYRAGATPREALLSLFALHNETANAWLHLAGLLLMLGAACAAAVTPPPLPAAVSLAPAFVYFFAAGACFAGSTSFHVFVCAGEELLPLLLSLDYAGIGLLISGACVAPIYYGFFCMPGFARGYLAAIAAACALATALTLQPRFRSEAFLLPRVGAFVVLALVCAVPLVHFALLPEARADPELRIVVQQTFLMMGLNALGTAIYATKLPERLVWPGSGAFDLLGSSHQIFHACILASATVHWLNVLRHAAWRGAHAECPA